MKRPSYRELDNKIRKAKEAVSTGRILLLNVDVIAEDAHELGFLLADLAEVLAIILDEIKPQNYIGRRPPERSYEQKIRDLELFAFRWESTQFGCEVYFKFSFNNSILYVVSLHQHRLKQKGGLKNGF